MNILVFQHVDVEHPGVFRDLWLDAGLSWHAVEIDEGEPIPSLEDFDLLVVMGGPMDVWEEDLYPWLKPEKEAIRRWVMDLNKPFLGICLGHQLLAEAVGGRVAPSALSEVGPTPAKLTDAGRSDPFFSGIGPDLKTFQWHSAEVCELPEGAVVLAENDACGVQAFRFGRYAYGLQYHVEITDKTISEWGEIPAYKASLEDAVGIENIPKMVAETTSLLPTYRAVAERLHTNFMTLIGVDNLVVAR
ncbi:type 1 glutamine amidotransferase [Roseibium sp. MMSF_3544]|uniref:type 1 glutamine amidotransferase n=1 Tax=unclassified Roseibium TaxID=2629323 RepID=UPI00273DE710|nr:type 1 glutamine amidotransferase [Roseibium sp. MMSF_3544]